ncbi:MAG: DUF4390 domain-containing protein [Comamonas sp.]|nr:DUF4390 domain-containing protein [Comamonas sp.]
MHCCASRWPDGGLPRRLCRALRVWLTALALLGLLLPVAQSQEAGRAPLQLRVERSAQGVFLSAVVPVQLPLSVENALLNGIAMHFVAQAQILRHRWYWSDKVLVNAMRYVRLSYQPLTRRWRVAQASEPIAPTGMGIALAQNYDTLQEALAAMGRISRWRVAQASELDEDTPYTLRLNYRLDTSQLPRPLQWGAVGGVNWNLQLEGAAAVPETAQPLPEVPPQEP